jgi:thiamine kinase-like enzyme
MENAKSELLHEIEHIFGTPKNEIFNFQKMDGSNIVYSFTVKNQKYVIKKLIASSIMDWEQEKEAYISLKPLKITDELVSYNNGIKITKYIDDSKTLTFCEADMIEALDLIRKVHESGITIRFNYNIIENKGKYIIPYDKKSDELLELENFGSKIEINTIQTIIDTLRVPPVLCHGDACMPNFLRLPDTRIKIIDWEQAGMADPLLDIAIASLHQGFDDVDPVWCLHQYLKRIPEKQEYLRLFSFLALDSYALMAWCIYGDPEAYEYYKQHALRYSGLVLKYY